MSNYVIKMPDIGEGIAEVELVKWYVAVGDQVTEDQTLADVMTDKAMVDIPSPVNGIVVSLGGQPGEVMAVGAELIRLQVEGAGNVGQGKARQSERQPVETTQTVPAPAPVPSKQPAPQPSAAAPERANTHAPAAAQGPARAPGEAPLASPAVRQHAWDLGIELRFVHGSGPNGRVLHEDLERFSEQHDQALTVAPAASVYSPRHTEEQIPVIGLRRKIAQKMQEAKRRIPHFTYVEEIDVTDLETLRAQLNQKWAGKRTKLTLLPFLARAMVVALRDFPQMNARYDDDKDIITRHGGVHLGIATQSENGLSVPVVRHAETLDLWGCAGEVARLADVVRSNKASREELSGSTITLSSLGPLGGIASTPIINYPEVAIIGPNKLVERPVIEGAFIARRKLMNMSTSFDHRIVNGYDAARFVHRLKRLLEHPALLFMD